MRLPWQSRMRSRFWNRFFPTKGRSKAKLRKHFRQRRRLREVWLGAWSSVGKEQAERLSLKRQQNTSRRHTGLKFCYHKVISFQSGVHPFSMNNTKIDCRNWSLSAEIEKLKTELAALHSHKPSPALPPAELKAGFCGRNPATHFERRPAWDAIAVLEQIFSDKRPL